ncbi:MAG: glycine--tRNA ligase subunit beta [Hydrogenothermaceae bacterium]|nr:glycine--tRNA ligase subunit beta [Hydrogenothermaceae bacterium]
MAEYLFEIGCEELPPKASNILREHFYNFFKEKFTEFFYTESSENIKLFSTPRRIGIYIKNLREKSPSVIQTLMGPPYKVAVDNEGKFTKAAISFAQKNSIPIEKLTKITTDKGEYIGAYIEREGENIEDFIKRVVPQAFINLPSLKSMRWNETNFTFPRPIRWILSLLDNEVIEFEIAGIKTSNYTHLHRFMTNPVGRGERKEINHPSEYEEKLKLGFIIPSFEERKKSIETQITGFAKTLDAEGIMDEELIDEVTNLTEFPVGILGEFSPEYLVMPDEVIITVCKHHQRYFNFKKNGKLIPKFLAFSNNAVRDRDVVKRGYEKVLRARLEDALFFYKEDLKKKLEDNIPKLKNIQFHEKLGSVYDKVLRNLEFAKNIATLIGYTDIQKLERSCYLSKADLLTEMVKEFDELQGIMGMYYALKQGEDEEVAKAIFEHYLPRTADDILPQTLTGTVLALADKLDTVISFISVGEIPKASADPFAIRRNAIGIIKILISKQINLDLSRITDNIQVLEFIKSRLESFLTSEGIPADIVNAVLSTQDFDPYSIYQKSKALMELKNNPEYEKIVMVFKRIANIVPPEFEGGLNINLFEKDEEVKLNEKLQSIKPVFKSYVDKKDYQKGLLTLLELKPYIDSFFDNVMVMVENQDIKNNRLALLKEINSLFRDIADFTKIIGG